MGLLEREVQQNRNLYDMFVGRLKETSTDGRPAVDDRARGRPGDGARAIAYAPKKGQIVGIAAAVALVLAAMLALLLDRLNNTLNSTSGVEQRLGVPALGVLQLIKGVGGAAKKKGFISELAFFNDSQSAFSEAVRTIRTSVLMSALDDPHKVVVVTSSVPEEGKTTVSYNLACALGQVKKVLLIDADMRRPKIAKLIGRDPKAPGLADLVAGQAQISQCLAAPREGGHPHPARGHGAAEPAGAAVLQAVRGRGGEAQGSLRHRHLRFGAAAARLRFAGAFQVRLGGHLRGEGRFHALPGGAERAEAPSPGGCAGAGRGAEPARPREGREVLRRIQRLPQLQGLQEVRLPGYGKTYGQHAD